jgi:hypothetical protein
LPRSVTASDRLQRWTDSDDAFMAELPRNLVVRRHEPVRRVVLWSVAATLGFLALYIVYEFGRFNAGYDRLAVAQQQTEFQVQIEHLERSNRELRTQLAELDTMKIGRTRERAELSRSIQELQAQVARQTQELAFYRGVVAPSEATLGVKIQQLRINATDHPDHYRVRMTMLQSARPDESVTGTLALTLDGEAGGNESSLDFSALTGGKLHDQSINFRYFESYDQEIVLPGGFRPERLTVEIRSARKGVAPLTQSFVWRVDTSS